MFFVQLPEEVLLHMCNFLCVATLGRLRLTCSHWEITKKDKVLKSALFAYDSAWYQFKDIILTSRYMSFFPYTRTQPPLSMYTVYDVALWGTMIDNDSLCEVATFGPNTLQTYINSSLPLQWKSNELKESFTLAKSVLFLYANIRVNGSVNIYRVQIDGGREVATPVKRGNVWVPSLPIKIPIKILYYDPANIQLAVSANTIRIQVSDIGNNWKLNSSALLSSPKDHLSVMDEYDKRGDVAAANLVNQLIGKYDTKIEQVFKLIAKQIH